AQMPHAAVFINRLLIAEPLPIDRAFTRVGIHGEVSDLKCGQVLEEMTALRGRDAEVAEAGFDDGAGSGDFVPLDGDPEPGIVRSPAADSDQQIRSVLRAQHGIEVGHGPGYLLAATAFEAL